MSSTEVETPIKKAYDDSSAENREPLTGDYHADLELRQVPPYMKWITASITLVTGVVCVYSFKIMNRQKSPTCEGCEATGFVGAFLQSLAMFIAEFGCLILYFGDKFLSKRAGRYCFFDFVRHPSDMERKKAKWWWWAIPCFFDFTGTTLCNVAYAITYASTVQMLRNFMVVVGAILQLVLVRKALRVHEYVGVFVITIAMTLAAIPAIQNPDTSAVANSNTALGVVFALVGTSLQACQLASEDKLFRKGRYNSVKAVGMEGFFGICFALISMPIADVTGFEKVWQSFYQWGHSGPLIGVTSGYVVAALLFNAFGISTVALATGLLRGVIFAVRAPIVWILDISLHWLDFDYYNLCAVFIFCAGFACYVALFPLPEKANKIWKKALHCACTKPELDEDYVAPTAPELAKEEQV